MIEQWPERDRLAVIAHELAHVLRHDLLAHHSMRMLRVLFWFLPPIWWMQRELHRAQDTACDECAAVVLGSGVEFGKALTQLADYCLITNPVYPALGILHAKPSLIQRLENIMNTQLTKLSRLSFTFKFSLTVASVCIVLLSGLVKQTVIAQTLDIEYLGNYSGGKDKIVVDGLAYFDPYYVIIGRQNGQMLVHFCTYKDKIMKVEHTAYLDTVKVDSNYMFKKVIVSDKYLAFSFKKDSKDGYAFYDRNTNWSISGIRLIPGITIEDMQIIDDDIYILERKSENGKEIFSIVRQNISTDHQINEYKIPDYIQAGCMTIIGNEVVLNDRDITIIDSASTKDKYGYIRGVLSNDGEVIVPDERWFVKGSKYMYLPFFMKGSFAYINFQQIPSFRMEMDVYDWSDKENPKLIQKFSPQYNFKEDRVYKDLLLLDKQLYRYDGTQYVKRSDFSQVMAPVVIGPQLVLGCETSELAAYDITDPSQLTKIDLPVIRSDYYSVLHAFGKYLIGRVHADENGFILKIWDAAVPADIKTVTEMFTPGKGITNIQFHHSLYSLIVNNPSPETVIYSFKDDSPAGTKVMAPPLLDDAKIVKIGDTLYNDYVYIQGYYFSAPNGHQTPDPAYQRLHIYRRNGNQIDMNESSTLELNINDSEVYLSDSLLITKSQEVKNEIVNKQNIAVTYNYVTIYSVENPKRPVLVSKYQIPRNNEDQSAMMVPQSMLDITVNSNAIAFTTRSVSLEQQVGVIDIRDPSHPAYQLITNKSSDDNYISTLSWYKNLLFVKTMTEIIIYHRDTTGNWTELERIQAGSGSSYSITENRLYISKGFGGIDTYQFRLDDTGIINWKQF